MIGLRHRHGKLGLLIALHWAIYVLFWIVLSPPHTILQGAVFSALLIWISVSDILTFEIPDTASLLMVCSGLVVASENGHLLQHIIAAAVWSGVFLLIAIVFLKLRGFDGLGFGDVKLMAGIGAWLGLLQPVHVVLSAAVSAILVLAISTLTKGTDSRHAGRLGIAFGPFICLSAWAVWLFGVIS